LSERLPTVEFSDVGLPLPRRQRQGTRGAIIRVHLRTEDLESIEIQ
jgi:hypothetical protein